MVKNVAGPILLMPNVFDSGDTLGLIRKTNEPSFSPLLSQLTWSPQSSVARFSFLMDTVEKVRFA
jgi:hypothetical protein